MLQQIHDLPCNRRHTDECGHLLQVIGEDACPGIKQNGFPYLIRRYVECLCPGDNIPPHIEVDISGLKLGQTVLPLQLKLPEGIKLVAQVCCTL